MRKFITSTLLALAGLMCSCSKDSLETNPNDSGTVDFRITTALPSSMLTKSTNSALGGVANVDNTLYDLRYICEVWTQEATPRLAYREIKTTNDFGQQMEFSARLLKKEYDFVFWADFVTADSKSDLFYTTTDLKNIEMKGTYGMSNDARDAYYANRTINLSDAGANVTGITLKRPFGKIRIVASDAVTTTLPERPKVATIKYTATEFPGGFNALSGEVTDKKITLGTTFPSTAQEVTDFVIGTSHYGDCYVIAFDYIFASDAMPSVAFNLQIFSDASRTHKIGEKDISSIPVAANKLTTVIGNLYTVEGKIKIVVTDPFDKEEISPIAAVDVNNISALNSALAGASGNNNSIKLNVTEPISGTSNNVKIPDLVMASNTPTVSLNFTKIETGTTVINITDETPGNPTNNYDGNLYVTVPDGTPLSQLNISVPKAHVVVYGSYGQIIAKTSPSTFVVSKGTKIADLQISGGNVEVHGTVMSLNIMSGNTESGIIRRLPGGDIKTIVSQGSYTYLEDFTTVSTTAEFLAAISSQKPRIYMNEGLYELSSAVTVNYPVEIFGEGGDKTVIKSTATAEPAMLISFTTGNSALIDGIGFSGQKKHNNAGCLLFGTTVSPNALSVNIVVNNCKFTDFTKNSITVKGGTATVSNNDISCGYLSNAASNGIQIDNGCVAEVTGNKIDGYQAGHPSWSATGLTVLRDGKAVKVSGNTFTNCQTAIYKETYYDTAADNTQLDAKAETMNGFTGCSWNVFRTSPASWCPATTLVVSSRAAKGYSLSDGTFQYAPPAQSFATIAAAVTAASTSTTTDIRIDTGNWEQATLGVAKNINFIGTGIEKTVLSATSGNVINVTSANAVVSFTDMHIKGLHTNTGIRFSANDMTVKLENVKVSDCKYGIYFTDNGNIISLTMENCLVDSNDAIGAYIGKAVTTANINNTTFSNNGNTDDASVNGIQKIGLQFCDWDGHKQAIIVTNSKFVNNGNSPSSVENRALTIYTALATQQASPILTMNGCTVMGNVNGGGLTPTVASAVNIYNPANIGNKVVVGNTTFSNNGKDLTFSYVMDEITNCGNDLTIGRR